MTKKRVLVVEKRPVIKMELTFANWEESFSGAVDFFKKVNFDIIVINVKVSEKDLPAIKEMLKKSKVIILSSVVDRGMIDFIIDISSNQDFFFVNNEKEAIQTVLDCLNEQNNKKNKLRNEVFKIRFAIYPTSLIKNFYKKVVK